MILVEMLRKDEWITLARETGYSGCVLSKRLHVSRGNCSASFGRFSERAPNTGSMSSVCSPLRASSSIKAVALDLGSKNASHFSHSFKRFYGMSPQHYVKQKEGTFSDYEI